MASLGLRSCASTSKVLSCTINMESETADILNSFLGQYGKPDYFQVQDLTVSSFTRILSMTLD